MKAAGVDIRPGDIATDSVEKLTSLLLGVDILISTVVPFTDQRPIFQAAKAAGVKRVLPSEFGPFIPEDVLTLADQVCTPTCILETGLIANQKYEIRKFIQSLGLNYTFVLIGCWLELMFPFPHSLNSELFPFEKNQNVFSAEGDKLLACTSRKSIGPFVARIISDPRTLNQVVIAYDVELSEKDAWKIAEKVTGEDFSDYLRVRTPSLCSFLSLVDTVKDVCR